LLLIFYDALDHFILSAVPGVKPEKDDLSNTVPRLYAQQTGKKGNVSSYFVDQWGLDQHTGKTLNLGQKPRPKNSPRQE